MVEGVGRRRTAGRVDSGGDVTAFEVFGCGVSLGKARQFGVIL